MHYLMAGIAFCSLALQAAAQQAPDISGSYKLVKGNCIYFDDQSKMVYIRGAMVLERRDTHAFAFYGAVTPKGYRTVGRTGIYDYRDGAFVYCFPDGNPSGDASDITFRNDTLFVLSRMSNAADTLVWKRVPAAQLTDKYLLRQIAESREQFKAMSTH